MYTFNSGIVELYMKKILLSTLVTGLFILNGFSKQKDENALVIPQSAQQNSGNQLSPTVIPSQAAGSSTPPQQIQNTQSAQQGQYKDGTYTGSIADAYYGNVQV